MLTAQHLGPASDWTRAIDYGYAEWSKHVLGNAVLRTQVSFDDTMYHLAACKPGAAVRAGLVAGKPFFVLGPMAELQGASHPTEPHVQIVINRNKYAWSFGPSPKSGKYWAPGVMLHEIGHALFAHGIATAITTPFELYQQTQAVSLFADTMHFSGSGTLMSVTINKGVSQAISEKDLQAAAASGVPLARGSTIYVVPNGRVSGTAKDVAVWMGTFSSLNATITGIKRLELRGDNPLSSAEGNLYRLYRAALSRAPDLGGFRYWLGTAKSLQQCAAGIMACAEFAPVLALWPDRARCIAQLYRNILGRDPDATGLAYWTGRADLDAAGLLTNLAVSAENKVGTPTFTL
ncbi:MAG TPA: DUF4214 domain-containing protein [Ramlibacter sp.]|jgi:hypothetical protein